jgi:hypothetical protein
VHEALDQFGAMFGPLLVALVLVVGHHDYKMTFAALAVPAVIMLSLEALEAVVAVDDQRLAGSGLPELRAELREFRPLARRGCSCATSPARLVARQQCDLRLGRLTLDGGPDPEAVLAAFDARMTGLDRQRSAPSGHDHQAGRD